MNTQKDEKWLDDQILSSIDSAKVEFDPEKWKQNYTEEVQILKSRLKQHPRRGHRIETSQIWRIIMKNRITKFAAAVIIIAVLIGINQFTGSIDLASVAWAEVSKKVDQIQTFTYRRIETQTHAGQKQMKDYITKVYSSSKYGTRMDSYTNGEITISTYTLRAEKILVSVMHPTKKYAQHPLDEEALRQMDKMGAKQIVKRFTSLKYKELGRKVIDGVEAEGIEVNDPKILSGANFPIDSLVARLWVNGATDLPILLEVEIIGNDGSLEIKMIMDQFQWNVQLDADEFEPNIPYDYTTVNGPGESEMNEQHKMSETTQRRKKVLTNEYKQIQMIIKEMATALFQAGANEDWEDFFKFLPHEIIEPQIKDFEFLGGLEVISIGEPFQFEDSSKWIVPYNVKLRDGKIREENLYIGYLKKSSRYIITGGLRK